MLIDLEFLYNKYRLNIKGVIHIGAHELEEKGIYNKLNIHDIIWIEGNQNIVDRFKGKGDKIYCEIISDRDNDEKEFIVTNNYQSSSILELETHKIEHPHIHEIQRYKVHTKTMDTFVKENSIDMSRYNFLNIDIQGAEYLALKGFENNLKYIDYLYLEVNERELYKNCILLPDLDKYLLERGFKRVELDMTRHGWGDGFYMRL